jgi:hypothetical protein
VGGGVVVAEVGEQEAAGGAGLEQGRRVGAGREIDDGVQARGLAPEP